jgi:hypothetical protein
MAPRSRRLAALLDEASWEQALHDPIVLRRRLVLAEILGKPLALRRDPRDLSSRRETGAEEAAR